MYVLRVKFKSGMVRRYAYGSKEVALSRMREWLDFTYVERVTVQAVSRALEAVQI